MRHFVLLVSIVLQVSPAAADAVTIVEKIIWVQTKAEHLRHCGGNPNTEACTYFVDERPRLTCSSDATGWRITSAAQLTAMVVLRRPGTILDKRGILRHEREHMADMHRSLEEHFTRLGGQRFLSESDCRNVVDSETQRFKEHLRKFARASSARRD